MSDTESFEYALWKSIDDCKIDENTDTITGSYTKSLSNQDRVVAAHIREIRDTAQQEYHRGFEAGKHSMDAEHRAVAMRLRGLRFDGGSHENLSRIAYAIYPCATGWTCESADGLRDKLIDLMGGVSDENVHVGGLRCVDGCRSDVSNGEDTGRTHDSPSNRDRNHMAVRVGLDTVIGDSDGTCDSQCRGACAADCGRDSGKHEEVGHGGAAHDSAADSRGGSRGELVHMDGLVAYDVLDNERRKAIAELRKMTIDSDYHGNYQRIALAIGTVYDGESFASECVRDRLIHLLGGDQPSGIDMLRAMDAESDTDGTCHNDGPTSSITDELREFVGTFSKRLSISVAEVNAIADRIDEQFNRICHQQEAVLQSTIDGVAQRLKDADKRLDDAAHDVEMWRDRAEDMRMERDELQAKLDAIRDSLDG